MAKSALCCRSAPANAAWPHALKPTFDRCCSEVSAIPRLANAAASDPGGGAAELLAAVGRVTRRARDNAFELGLQRIVK